MGAGVRPAWLLTPAKRLARSAAPGNIELSYRLDPALSVCLAVWGPLPSISVMISR